MAALYKKFQNGSDYLPSEKPPVNFMNIKPKTQQNNIQIHRYSRLE